MRNKIHLAIPGECGNFYCSICTNIRPVSDKELLDLVGKPAILAYLKEYRHGE